MRVTMRPSAGRETPTLTPYYDVQLSGTTYPSTYLYSGGTLVQPLLETTQSTGVSTADITEKEPPASLLLMMISQPVFFFVYNTDNYFHFLYDAVPTLYQYLSLRKTMPTLRLLMTSAPLYPFVMDTLSLLGIRDIDTIRADPRTLYKTVLVASSPTHEGCSNEPPHPSVWSVYNRMKNAAETGDVSPPKKVYVSRRSWVHGDTSNLGTNYTTRRRMECEDELVEALKTKGYEEVFCESLTMAQKVRLFSNATHVVGAIGGGMCNLVFANPTCKVVCIVSPEFERINNRFLYTIQHTDLTMLRTTWSTSTLYRRAKVGSFIGEVWEDDGETLTLALSNGVTWGDGQSSSTLIVPKDKVTFLDEGLNSPWNFDVKECMKLIQ
jgi:hypothetical protein